MNKLKIWRMIIIIFKLFYLNVQTSIKKTWVINDQSLQAVIRLEMHSTIVNLNKHCEAQDLFITSIAIDSNCDDISRPICNLHLEKLELSREMLVLLVFLHQTCRWLSSLSPVMTEKWSTVKTNYNLTQSTLYGHSPTWPANVKLM